MGLLSRAGDLVYTFRFLKLLTTSWEDTGAFKAGLIDNAGKRIKSVPIDTPEKKAVYNAFHKLVFNIKKLIPGKKFGSYAAALFLLKEKYGVSDFDKVIKESGLDPLDFLLEESSWFIIDGDTLAPGVYKLADSKVLNESCEEVVTKGDRVRIKDNTKPVGDVLGINVYEATHLKTNKQIYVTVGELLR